MATLSFSSLGYGVPPIEPELKFPLLSYPVIYYIVVHKYLEYSVLV